jgi:tRNA threonylcarbamoyladenosine biosynthesis protein TsaE
MALGTELGKLLAAGDVVTLTGELGGGKTCFVRGIVAGAAPQYLDLVASPTFAILNEYPAVPPIHHYDCYRLRGCDDAVELGLEEHLHGNGICLIEWPDRILALLPPSRLELGFSYVDATIRRISLFAHGTRLQLLLAQLATHCDTSKKPLSPLLCSAK